MLRKAREGLVVAILVVVFAWLLWQTIAPAIPYLIGCAVLLMILQFIVGRRLS